MPAAEPWPVQPLASLRTTIVRYWRTFFVRTVVYLILLRRRFLHPPPFKPTLTKSYPHLPKLHHRIFYPSTYDRTNPNAPKLPIYIDFHGGGFILGDAALDDDFCRPFADEHHFLVVSIEYALAPVSHFPGLIFDAAASIDAILADPTLPYDPQRIVIGGFSAGGTAAFSVAQLIAQRHTVRALVGFYTCLDMHTHTDTKLQNRTKRSLDQPDNLARAAPLLCWAYIKPGQDLQDGLLSPAFAHPDRFPRHVYLISAEYDVLSHESRLFAEKIAKANREREGKEGTSAERVELTDAKVTGEGWREGSVRWEIATGFGHGFTQESMTGTREKGAEEFCAQLYTRVGRWLWEDVFAEEMVKW